MNSNKFSTFIATTKVLIIIIIIIWTCSRSYIKHVCILETSKCFHGYLWNALTHHTNDDDNNIRTTHIYTRIYSVRCVLTMTLSSDDTQKYIHNRRQTENPWKILIYKVSLDYSFKFRYFFCPYKYERPFDSRSICLSSKFQYLWI